MRNGILLAEDTPVNIMIRFESNSIEDAFLILSRKQGKDDIVDSTETQKNKQPQPTNMASVEIIEPTAITQKTNSSSNTFVDENDNNTATTNQVQNKKRFLFTTRGRIKALMTKNFVQLFRQPS